MITTQKLNHMEDGIAAGGMMVVTITDDGSDGYTADKTYAEIEAAYLAMPVVVRLIDGGDHFYHLADKNDAVGTMPASIMFKNNEGDAFDINVNNAVEYVPIG